MKSDARLSSLVSYRVIGNHENVSPSHNFHFSFLTFLYRLKKQFIIGMLCVNYYAAISSKIRRMEQRDALMYVDY